MISVIIITKNEEQNIGDCLESVSWADEIVVMDSGSTDRTIEICQKYTDKIFVTDWPGFGPQKNRVLKKATQPWVLSLDADERVTDSLRQQIFDAVASGSKHSGYEISRKLEFCGRTMDRFGLHPDYVLRLFRRDCGHFSNDAVHERVILEGSCGKLTAPLLHFSFDNLEQVLNKMDHYSSLGAQQLFERGRRATYATAIGKGFWSFVRSYFFQLGFVDGKEGLMLAVSYSEGTYYKYAKLALLCGREKESG